MIKSYLTISEEGPIDISIILRYTAIEAIAGLNLHGAGKAHFKKKRTLREQKVVDLIF